MARRRTVIAAILVGIIAAVGFMILSVRNSARMRPASITFLGFTNAPSGVRLARFEIRNELNRRNTLSGYCRVNSDIVDIMPSKPLFPRQAQIVDVPLVTHSGNPVDHLEIITFNGTRSLRAIEDLCLAFQELLDRIAHNTQPSEPLIENRWELSHRFTGPE